jgi:hypothetical protein
MRPISRPAVGEADCGVTAFGDFAQVEMQEPFEKLVHFADLRFRRFQSR